MKSVTLKSITLLTSLTAALGLAACGGGSSSGGGDNEGVAAAASCYFIPSAGISFEWPGGAGPNLVEFSLGPSCEGSLLSGFVFVVAVDADAAAEQCAEAGANVVALATNPGVEDGSFFSCQGVPGLG